jgi:hypothetical protein
MPRLAFDENRTRRLTGLGLLIVPVLEERRSGCSGKGLAAVAESTSRTPVPDRDGVRHNSPAYPRRFVSEREDLAAVSSCSRAVR